MEEVKPVGKIVTGAKLRLVFQVPKELEPLTPETGRDPGTPGKQRVYPDLYGNQFQSNFLVLVYEDETFSPEF